MELDEGLFLTDTPRDGTMNKFFMFWSIMMAFPTSLCVAADPLETLVGHMIGYFNSSDQARTDSSYLDISLHVVRIWERSGGEYWLYVEQAVTTTMELPYRQRIYHVVQLTKDVFKSSVYTLSEDRRFAGAWAQPERFDSLGLKDIQLKSGCEVILKLDSNGSFQGGTEGSSCVSTLRGASYATSEVSIDQEGMTSWDRGFDAAGNQVWGATKGGYRFVKKK